MNANAHYITQPLKLKYENEFDAFIQMKEGVAIGSLHQSINVVVMRTFVTNDMLKGEQVDLSKMLDERFQLGAIRKKEEEK